MTEIITKSGFHDHEVTRWGAFYSVFHKIDGNRHTKVKVLNINKGMNISYQMHNHRREVWQVINGGGTFVLNGKFQTIVAGDIVNIPQGSWHALKAEGTDIEIVEIQYGDKTEEDDIVRIYYDWNDIARYVKEV
jgi:mannose-1-phosphate guanylyltransferase